VTDLAKGKPSQNGPALNAAQMLSRQQPSDQRIVKVTSSRRRFEKACSISYANGSPRPEQGFPSFKRGDFGPYQSFEVDAAKARFEPTLSDAALGTYRHKAPKADISVLVVGH
jgi:hypothetical protein